MYRVYYKCKNGFERKTTIYLFIQKLFKKMIWNVHRALKYKMFVEKKVNEKSKENAHEFGIHIKYMK